jgi:hypothetical protein
LQGDAARCTCAIPPSGILLVKGNGPFSNWHTLSASWDDGSTLPAPDDDHPVSAETVALWSMFSLHDNTIWYYVGVKAEKEKFARDPNLIHRLFEEKEKVKAAGGRLNG